MGRNETERSGTVWAFLQFARCVMEGKGSGRITLVLAICPTRFFSHATLVTSTAITHRPSIFPFLYHMVSFSGWRESVLFPVRQMPFPRHQYHFPGTPNTFAPGTSYKHEKYPTERSDTFSQVRKIHFPRYQRLFSRYTEYLPPGTSPNRK